MGLYLRGTTWWMKYKVDGATRRESTDTHDRKKAVLVLKQKLAEGTQRRLAVKMGLPVPEDLADARLTLDAFLERYEAHYLNAGGPALKESRERSWRGDSPGLRSVVGFLRHQGVTLVSRVTSRHVEAFRDWRLTTTVCKGKKTRCVSGATVNHNLRIGKAAFSWAVRVGIIHANPFKGVKLVKLPVYEPRNLSEFEVRRVLDVAKEFDAFALVATAIYGGLRLSELIALEWPDVDIEAGEIRVSCDETFLTKSRKPRVVPIAPELRAILEPIATTAGLCFPSEAGTRRDPANVRKTMLRIGKKAGADLTPHDLRRTFASLLASKGVPTTRIRDYLGHASIATTEGYYVARGQVNHDDVAKLSFGQDAPNKAPRGRKLA